MTKRLSRRRFLFLSGAGLASGTAALHDTQNLRVRFLGERLAELVKPAIPARHKPDPAAWDDNAITASWLGHATMLINFYGVKIITDPVLFSRIGANSPFGTIGPMRRQACALKPSELPKIELVLLSHAHMDHFDSRSINALPGRPEAVTAKATADLLRDSRVRKIHELGWGGKTSIQTAQGAIEVEGFEVRHWGARWRHDKHRGFNGYIIRREGKQIVFGGDTAMSSGFKDIAGKGPFEFACMPIGAYEPWIASHCTPEEALRMANEAGARHILPMHHFTFRLGRERSGEPIERLQAALQKEPERLGFKEAGETFAVAA